MKRPVAEETVSALKALRATLPTGFQAVVLVFDDAGGEALMVSTEPYPEALKRVEEWVKAQHDEAYETDSKAILS